MVTSWFMHRLTVFLICAGFFVNVSFARSVSEPDHEIVPEWLVIKDLMFGEKNIRSGEGVISLYLNTKLDDVSTVPIMVNANLDQTEERYIQAIYLVVDRNPIPTAGKFRFTPQSGRVKLETRLRFEKFSFVRAVAELNTGELYMDQRWVEVSGGCSAPSGKNGDDPSFGKIRFRADDRFYANEPNLVQVQIKHPNESALASDLEPGHDARFIDKIDIAFDDALVMSADVNFSISDNPVFKFYFLPETDGRLTVKARDTHDTQFSDSIQVLTSDK